MVKSMFAGVAGLRTHQAKMDVIGNNIANVNTWGFKAGSMSFKDTMYQNTSSGSKGSTAAGSYGGSNANQVGYGVTTGSISYDFSMGSMSPSARGLDAFIDGTGFFIVGPMVGDGSGFSLEDADVISANGLFLSRVGKFDVDNQGYLVDDSGNYVYGFSNESSNLSTGTDFNTDELKPLRIPLSSDMADVGNADANSKVDEARAYLAEVMANLSKLKLDLGTAKDAYIKAKEAYEAALITADIEGAKTSRDTAKTAAETAYKNWSDGNGTKWEYEEAKIAYEKSEYDYLAAQAKIRLTDDTLTSANTTYSTEITAYLAELTDYQTVIADPASTDADKAAAKTAYDTAFAAISDYQTALSKLEAGSLEGVKNSTLQAVNKYEALVTAAEKSVTDAEARLDTAQKSATSTEVKNAESIEGLASLTNYTIQKDGTLTGTTEEGITVIIGKIALAGIQNTSGLEKTTGYYYTTGPNAGNVGIYEAGGAQGQILGNYLEMAKVDLATEMTDMITTQRGFQANSKIITVTDQMLEELVNIKR